MYEFLERYAIYSYELLQLKQPHLITEGIYRKDIHFFIKCQNLNIAPLNSQEQSIVDVFDKEIRVLGCPIQLVIELPEGVTRIENRKQEEIINLVGNPLNIFDFNKQLSLMLPSGIPRLWVDFNHTTKKWDVLIGEDITNDYKAHIKDKLNALLGYDTEANIIVKPIEEKPKFESENGLSISVSKHYQSSYSRAVSEKWEQDEQIWTDNKEKLFLLDNNQDNIRNKAKSSCLINATMGEAHDIRNYLTLFDEINIVIPIESRISALLHSLDIKEGELLRLLELNRVRFIFPHSLNRYDRNFVEKAVNVNPNNLMLSRELAYKTVTDLKNRNPLSFLPLDIEERRKALAELIEIASITKGSRTSKWLNGLATELSNTWSHMYELLSIRGALGTFNVGLGPLVNTTIMNLTGSDYFLEIMQASNSIEWAAANQAILCPVGTLANNEVNLANLYSGVRLDWDHGIVTKPNLAIEGILTIARHVPVLELAEVFNSDEISQFRNLLIEITHNKKPEDIESAINDFNDNVKRFENKNKRIDTWDIKGVLLDAGLEITNATIPFSGFIAKLLGRLVELFGDKYRFVGDTAKQVESKIYRTTPNVILVSRMRNKIKDLL